MKHQYKGTFKTDMDSLALLTVPVGPDLPPQSVVSKTVPPALHVAYAINPASLRLIYHAFHIMCCMLLHVSVCARSCRRSCIHTM